jgi:predicted MPP superfamily phosphohydrolase
MGRTLAGSHAKPTPHKVARPAKAAKAGAAKRRSIVSAPTDDITVLFRFRNLMAETLFEHKKVIEKSGYCWWGWWKRPTEDARSDIWTYLKQATSERKVVTVGLFDSGTGTVHRARIASVLPPTDDAALASPALEKNERTKVPAYYRKSPFSRAWLKIVAIEDLETDFFMKHAYRDPPPLPGIASVVLEQLKGKLVVDAAELRAMDTTIWTVQPQTGGSSERFIAASSRMLSSVSKDPIRLNGTWILHLSDLHFDERLPKDGGQHIWARPNNESLSNMIAPILEGKYRENIGLIVITGDITTRTRKAEFDEASRAIQALFGHFDIGPNNLVICPGNHDIEFTAPGKKTFDPKSEVAPRPSPGSDKFRAFYNELLGHAPNEDLSMGRRFVMPNGRLVEVMSLNSSRLEQGDNYLQGMGSVGPNVLIAAANELGWLPSVATPALRILALHHHVKQVSDVVEPDEYSKGFGLAIDAPEVMRLGAERGVRLVLHGHRHQSFFAREEVSRGNTFDAIAPVAIAGSGSVGSSETPERCNQFHVIKVEPDALVIEQFQSKLGRAFQITGARSASFGYEGGGLILGPWCTSHHSKAV